MKFKSIKFTFAAVATMALLAGCAQSSTVSTSETPSAAKADNTFTLPTTAPSGFKKGLKVALVRQSGVGDYFEQWGNGFTSQVKAAGGTVQNYDARGDNGKQVSMFGDAINSKPDVIVVDHGLADSINPKVDEAINAGIPVTVYDAAITNQKALYVSQDDESLAQKILDEMKKENPKGGNIMYVNVSGIAPLDTRDGVFKKFIKENPEFKISATCGKYTESTAADTASECAASLKSAPDTNLVFAAYDELAKGSLIALRQNNMTDKVKVYGVDISTADIQLMTAKGSPWRATAATDPSNVGAINGRAAIAAAAGVKMPSKFTIPAALITQDLLNEKNVSNMDDLRKALPDLTTPDVMGASWIPTVGN